MSAIRDSEFIQLTQTIQNLDDVEPLAFSQMRKRERKTKLRHVNKTFEALLEETVGTEKSEQGKFLIFLLKRLFPQTGWLSLISKNIGSFKNYGEMSKFQKKSLGRTAYPIFDTFFEKIIGSSDMEVQRSFLNARFNSKHADNPDF